MTIIFTAQNRPKFEMGSGYLIPPYWTGYDLRQTSIPCWAQFRTRVHKNATLDLNGKQMAIIKVAHHSKDSKICELAMDKLLNKRYPTE